MLEKDLAGGADDSKENHTDPSWQARQKKPTGPSHGAQIDLFGRIVMPKASGGPSSTHLLHSLESGRTGTIETLPVPLRFWFCPRCSPVNTSQRWSLS
jgi:hypothetical protein